MKGGGEHLKFIKRAHHPKQHGQLKKIRGGNIGHPLNKAHSGYFCMRKKRAVDKRRHFGELQQWIRLIPAIKDWVFESENKSRLKLTSSWLHTLTQSFSSSVWTQKSLFSRARWKGLHWMVSTPPTGTQNFISTF